MDWIYNCEMCDAEFNGNAPHNGRIPQSNFLKRASNLVINDRLIGRLPIRCFNCDTKLLTKIARIVGKKRKPKNIQPFQVNVDEATWEKEMANQPFGTPYEIWKIEMLKKFPYICNSCGNYQNEDRKTFRHTINVKQGYSVTMTQNDICNACFEEIVNDVKELILVTK